MQKIDLVEFLEKVEASCSVAAYVDSLNGERHIYKFFPEFLPKALWDRDFIVKKVFISNGSIAIIAQEVK